MASPHRKQDLEDEYEGENMEDVQYESPPPASPTNQPRRRGSMNNRLIDEILQQSRDDAQSYTNKSLSISQAAKEDPTFTGQAYFYHLNHRKALDLIHGTYVIVYARPVVAERDRFGGVVADTFEPDIKNTICIFTKPIIERTQGHRKVNELLGRGLRAVGMLHFRSRNLTLWMTNHIFDSYTAASTYAFSTNPTNVVENMSRAFEEALRQAPTAAPAKPKSALTFGAKITREILDVGSNFLIDWGYEFVTLEFLTKDQYGEAENYMCVAVKVPDKGDVSSAFILEQRLYCPLYKTAIMKSYTPEEVEFKPRYPVKKKVTTVKIAPRPQGNYKDPDGLIVGLPALGKPAVSGSSRNNLRGKPTFKRWQKRTEEEFDENEWERIEEADEMNVESDVETVKG